MNAMRREWTEEETDELRRVFHTMTARQLADRFGRSERAIYVKCFYLGLKKGCGHAKIRLSGEDRRWLQLNFPHMSNEICAMKLGVSPRTVVRLARSYGFKKTPQFMKECQAHAAGKAKESHLHNGTYPARGWYSPNLQKGEKHQFKPSERHG